MSSKLLGGERAPLMNGRSVQDREEVPPDAELKSQPAPLKATVPLIFSLIAALGALQFGYILGYTSPVGKSLMHDKHPTDGGVPGLGLTSSENSLFGSLATIGAMVGALLGGVAIDTLGRRGTIAAACVPAIGGFLLIGFAANVVMLQIGRILTGFSVGMTSVGVPVYIAEIAPPALRGGMGSIFQLAITIGILFVYGIGIPVTNWRTLAYVGAIPSGLLLVACVLVLPRTARFLLSTGKTEEARAALMKLRRTQDVDAEIMLIQESITEAAKTGKATVADCFRGTSRKAMIVGALLMVYQQFSGINVVVFYANTICSDAGLENANVSALSLAVTQVVVTAIACMVIDKTGRRPLMMVAGIGMSGACVVLGYFFYLKAHGNNPSGAIALVAVISYVMFFASGLGAIPWLMMSEIFPGKVRGMAASIITLLNWTLAFIITETFDGMINTLQEYGTFWFYGAVCMGGVIYVLLGVPETKGKTLEEIQAYFEGTATGASDVGASNGITLVKFTAAIVYCVVGVLVAIMSL